MHIFFLAIVLIIAITYIYSLYYCSVVLYNAFIHRFKFLKKRYFYIMFFGSFVAYLISVRLPDYIVITPLLYRIMFYYGFVSLSFVLPLFFLLILWRIISMFYYRKIVLIGENHDRYAVCKPKDKGTGPVSQSTEGHDTCPQKLNFNVVSGILIIVILINAIGIVVAVNPVTTKYDIEIAKKSSKLSELRITMVSDVHVNDIFDTEKLESMSLKINDKKGDIVVFSGDMTNGKISNINKESFVRHLSTIKAQYGKYAVLGNHDYYSEQEEELVFLFEQAGVKVLRNQMFILEGKLCIIGREDNYILTDLNERRKSLESIVGNEKNDLPMILIDHRPSDFDEAEKFGIAIKLSGHTHKGQIFPGFLVTKQMYVNDYGLYKKNDFISIVSSGYSTWGPPIRLGTVSEVVVIDVNFK